MPKLMVQPGVCCKHDVVAAELSWNVASMRSTPRLLNRAVRLKDHVTLQHQRINVVAATRLHEQFLERSFTSCVWASASVVRDCKLARRGEEPVTAPQHSGGVHEYYNLNQLLNLARTATGTWFPMNLQRTLTAEGFKQQYRSTVWFREHQVGSGIVPRTGQVPSLLKLGGNTERLYNTDQLVPPFDAQLFDNGIGTNGDAARVNGPDVFVMTYAAAKNGFVSNRWCAESIVGLRPGVELRVKLFHRRFGTVGMYNHDQLEWPIPALDPPHRWASGAMMFPHDQVVLEQARVTLGLASRRWVAAQPQVARNNVLAEAIRTTFDNAIPRGVQEVVNVDQLIDAHAASPT
jgi:hypothetical protein